MSTVNRTLPQRLQRRAAVASDVDTPVGHLTLGALRGSTGGIAGGFVYCLGIACGFWTPAIEMLGASSAVVLAGAALGGAAGWIGAAFAGEDMSGMGGTVRAL